MAPQSHLKSHNINMLMTKFTLKRPIFISLFIPKVTRRNAAEAQSDTLSAALTLGAGMQLFRQSPRDQKEYIRGPPQGGRK